MSLTARAALYREPAVWRLERERVFGRSWLFLGLERDLAAAGDYLADDLAGFPVLAVRGDDGALRAFHNVCRHRAGPLVSDGKGRCEGELVCKYHGWRYTLDGRLRAARDFGALAGFDPRDYGLFPLRLETWRGFVFVNADPGAAPLAQTFAPLDAIWEARGFRLPEGSTRRSHSLACDWKVYVENYLEGYHVETAHPGLTAQLDTKRYEVSVTGAVAFHTAPATDGAAQEGVWAWVWPNLAFNLYRSGIMVEHMRPDGFGRTRLDYLFFHEPGADMAETLAFSEQVTAEDVFLCEAVQRNLNAGVYEAGVLSPRHEVAVAWFQQAVAEALADGGAVPSGAVAPTVEGAAA